MKFEINGSNWNIVNISSELIRERFGEEGYYTHGYTNYSENCIYINKESLEIDRTLKHELTHCWLHTFGHNQDNRTFNSEDVCEIVASSNNFINNIIERYHNEKDND